ncbi:hypothetical protein [Acidicapsa ligni]|uniref:hypothetical protein n=1 Tax=Acidicapsa ligni TaxID=542300 RepID=UPI0021DFE47A|nr:hypothetical protein [Acidicapsa ligni]
MRSIIALSNVFNKHKFRNTLVLVAIFLLVLCSTQTGFSQAISWGTPQQDTTTPIGGADGADGAAAAVFNNKLYAVYAGATVNSAGNADVDLAYNTDGGVTYPNKSTIASSATNVLPGIAVFNNLLYVAYVTQLTGATRLEFQYSSDGIHWSSANPGCDPGFEVDGSPSLAVYKGFLYLGIRDHTTQAMVICQVAANNQTTVEEHANVTLNFNPTFAVFNNLLYVATESNDDSHTIYLYTSADGSTFELNTGASSDQTSRAPSMAVHNNILYLGFRENDGSIAFLYKYSTDGVNFSTAINPHWQVNGPPILLQVNNLTGSPNNGQLYMYYSSFSPTHLCSNHGE